MLDKYKSVAVGGIATFTWCILDIVISFIANDFGDKRRVAMVIVLFIVSILGGLFIYFKKPVVSIIMYGIGILAAIFRGIFMNLGIWFTLLNVGF